MRRAIIIPLFFLFAITGFSQKDTVAQVEEESNVIFKPVEIESIHKDGRAAWKKFIEDNLRYPKKAKKHFPPGTVHTIQATFIVERDSTLSAIEIKDDPGYGFRKEIKRLLILGGKWRPAMQNGRVVKAFKRQEFIFRRPD